jgi:Raf kinase inhibitor-like YbhB/YbcL family protein
VIQPGIPVDLIRLAGTALLAVAVVACGSSGTTPRLMETAMTANDFRLTSTAFEEGGSIPAQFSCDGSDVSPELSWDGAPAETASFALIVDDPDARGFVHWVAFGLTGSASGGLAEGVSSSPDAPPQGTNGFGRIGWGGPCPPSGEHRYVFRLLALDDDLGLTGSPKAAEVLAAAEGHVLAEASLTGTYRRGG